MTLQKIIGQSWLNTRTLLPAHGCKMYSHPKCIRNGGSDILYFLQMHRPNKVMLGIEKRIQGNDSLVGRTCPY